MCERLVIPGREEVERELAVCNRWWSFETRFNVAPAQRIPAVRIHEKESEGVMLRWGLIPSSARREAPGPGATNIRLAALEDVPEYRNIWMHAQRCIVPMAGFYLWQPTAAGHRQPFYVRLVNRPVFGVAALWDRFVTAEDDVIEGCALLEVTANALLAGSGAERHMPAVLFRENYTTWLSGRPAEARELLQVFPAERMVTHAVGPRINFPEFDDASLIRPID